MKKNKCEVCKFEWENGVLDIAIPTDEDTIEMSEVTIDINECPRCITRDDEDEEKAYIEKLLEIEKS